MGLLVAKKLNYMILQGIDWIVFHGYLDYFQKPTWESMTLQTLTTVDLLYFVMVENPHE